MVQHEREFSGKIALSNKENSKMKRGQYTEEQIIGILNEVENGQKVTDVCRKYGISEGTFYRWKSAYGGLEVSQMRRLRQLEDENRRLKNIVADLTLDNTMLKDITSKKW
jgi:putative transposase